MDDIVHSRSRLVARDKRIARVVVRTFAAAVLLLLIACLTQLETTTRAERTQDVATVRLEAGKVIQTTIARGQRHSYNVVLPANTFLEILITQRDVDVAATLFDPGGAEILTVDQTEAYGPEIIMGVMRQAGTYRIEVGPTDESAASGRYEIALMQSRPAQPDDKVRIDRMTAAFDASSAADELSRKGDDLSLKSAVEKYNEALSGFRQISNKHWEASTLLDLGNVFQRLGRKDQALETYTQALQIFKSLDNPREQIFALEMMAKACDTLNSTSADRRKALDYHTKALPLIREIRDGSLEAQTLNHMGLIHNALGQHSASLKYFNDALSLAKTLPDRDFEGKVVYNLGRAYSFLSEAQKALELFEQALSIFQKVSDSPGQSFVLHNMGSVYHALGEMQKALEFYHRSLSLDRANDDKLGEGTSLNDIGGVYSDLGEKQKALEFYTQALSLRRKAEDHSGEAITLGNIGALYDSLGQRQTALDFYNQSLTISRQIDDVDNQATALNNLGFLWVDLGEQQKGLECYNQALELYRASEDRSGEATTLNNLGRVYDDLGQRRKALDLFTQALTLHHAIGDRGGEATTLNNLGGILYDVGEKQEALSYFNQAIDVTEAIGDLTGQAVALNGAALIYSESKEKDKAISAYATALSLQHFAGELSGEASTLANLEYEYKQRGQFSLAIFYGKQAINLYQSLRTNIQTLNKEQQKSYLSKVEPVYRSVSDLLLSQQRLSEAHQVLNLFKDQQFFDFNRTGTSQPSLLTLTARETKRLNIYRQNAAELGNLFQQVRKLRLTSGEELKSLPEYQKLNRELSVRATQFKASMNDLETEFSRADAQTDKAEGIQDTSELQRALRELRTQTKQVPVAVYTLVGEDAFSTLVVTPDAVFASSQHIKGETLNEKALQLWGLLQSDKYDPIPLAQQLYTVVFKPIEAQLPKDTTTILWMLDGNLRYVPMGVLHDGQKYLIERYNHAVFTRADSERLLRAVSAKWTGVGLGSSQAHAVEVLGEKVSFNALPGVTEELRLFRQNGSASGAIDGEVLADAKFTKSAMLDALKRRRPLVHISSHFSFRPGDEARSFLLLGDGTAMTLAEMKEYKDLFAGVELLTLSACNTAAQQPGASGREIDGFAELAQRLGAGSVMATLWPVADNSTPWLMRQFYQSRQSGEGLTKAEAFRRAQLALLNGTAQTQPLPAGQKGSSSAVSVVVGDDASSRGDDANRRDAATRAAVVYVSAKDAPTFKRDASKPFAHPYYWAPFILIGNWK